MPPIPREILNPSISRIYPLLPPRPPLPRLHQRRLFIISSTLSLSRCNISRQLLANISRHFNPSRAISIRYVFPPNTCEYFCLSFATLTLIFQFPFCHNFCGIAKSWWIDYDTSIEFQVRSTTEFKTKHVRIFNNKHGAFTFRRTKENCAKWGILFELGVFIDLSRVRNWI